MSIYLDNAATTPLHPAVLEEMIPVLKNQFGNPSSIHKHGREAKTVVEQSRKTIAGLLNTSPSEIFFTSSGTEADNTAIYSSIMTRGIKHVISSAIEHHAVLHPLQYLHKKGMIELHYVAHREDGSINMTQLEELAKQYPESLISIMHANNEIGNLNPIHEIGQLARKYNCLFHTDTVQTLGHLPLDLQQLPVDFITGSAHKFHGPKGVGILYINAEVTVEPFIHGGAQERNMRGGTENVAGIAGMAKALEIALANRQADHEYVSDIKQYMAGKLKEAVPGIIFYGTSASADQSLYTVLNAGIPPCPVGDMLLFSLDIKGIAVSGGSACSSGTDVGSHVLDHLHPGDERIALRFSFSKFNTKEEIDTVVETLKKVLDK